MTDRESSGLPFKYKRCVVRHGFVTLCEKLAAEGFAGISGWWKNVLRSNRGETLVVLIEARTPDLEKTI
jgi:hypothetical protein